jgi:hypothetical protein
MATSDHLWKELCDDHRVKQDAYTQCLNRLFSGGRIVSKERLEECEQLRAAVREVRKRMDDFLEPYKPRL